MTRPTLPPRKGYTEIDLNGERVYRNTQTGRIVWPSASDAGKAEALRAAAYEKRRPLTEAEVTRLLIAEQINTIAVDDSTSLRMKGYYPTFEELCEKTYVAKNIGFKFTYDGELWKTRQANYTFVSHYPPGTGTESLFERVDEVHDGSKYDPIPYDGNMELFSGKHYSEEGVLFFCFRDSGQPVYARLAELVGLYVEEVTT